MTQETRLKLWNVSSTKMVLQLPSIFHHLPHLQHPESLQPAVHVGQGRTGVSIVLGVPSVKREVHSYLSDTLTSLMSELSPAEKDDCVIVVLVAELEDDIVARPNYFTTMKNFALQQPSEEWMILEFSQLGFIGKMFKSEDLPMIVEFMLMFYKDKPIDWLLDHIMWVKVCNPEKDADKDFGKQHLHKGHINPAAELSSSLKTYQHFTLEKAYQGDDFFWAFTPVAGDFIRIRFFTPVRVER
uniref:Alpha-1,3-mannosyl-glycoprotein 4-beta-N-acetylglucosaminyltransferase B n=1 Tax=Knipowitschia caucasica TaxID=637954 RepID=A0AAV2KA50_KNICA